MNKRETSKINNDQNQINQLKYSEIQKTEKPKESEKTNNLDHLQVDFDGLSIVDEEEEQKKIKILSNEDLTNCSINSRLSFFSSPIFTPCPFIFPNPDHVIPTTSSQVFDSTSPLKLDTQVAVKLDTPLPESRNSKFPKLPKASVTFENSSPTTIYLESPRFFTKTNQTENQIGKVENFNSNDTQIGMSPLNARPKQIFAPLKFESKGIFFAKQSPRIELFPKQSTGNEFFPNHSSRNEIFPKQSLENEIFSRQLSRNGIIMNQLSENEILQECQDNQSNDKIVSNIVINELNYPTFKEFNSRKKKSISLENLPADKTQHFTNESMNNCKLFSSCRNLNTKFSQFSQERETMDFFPNCQSPKECYNNSRDNYDPSKPFKSQLSVVLKSPCSNNIPKETPEIKLLTKNCKSLNNLHFQNGEISAFNKNFPLLNEDDKERYHEYQATSFEGPLPITLQIPSMMPIEMDYKNVPFLSRRFYYPGEEMKFFYDSIPQKISAHTQTLDEDIPLECTRSKKDLRIKNESQPKESALNRSRKKTTKKENFERKPTVDRKKRDILKKQVSISSCEESESQNAIAGTNFEIRENKHESRSSSSDVDSQKKEQTHRVSIYFNSKKRPSLTSMKSTRNMDNSRNKIIPQKDHSDGNTTNLGEQVNSVNSKEIGNSKRRKTSTSSESVPWCACWGNGCI